MPVGIWVLVVLYCAMITFKCDKCEKLLNVPEDQAGKKVSCPACGDVNVVPLVLAGANTGSGSGSAGRKDRAAEAGYPPAEGPEQRVLYLRTAMARSHPLAFLATILGLVGGLAAGFGFGIVTPPAIAGWCIASVALVYLAYWKIQVFGASLEITNKRVVERKGIFTRFVSEVRHQDIRNIQVRQSFVDRIMNVGEIGISSAGQSDIEIDLKDVRDPTLVRKVIDLYRPL